MYKGSPWIVTVAVSSTALARWRELVGPNTADDVAAAAFLICDDGWSRGSGHLSRDGRVIGGTVSWHGHELWPDIELETTVAHTRTKLAQGRYYRNDLVYTVHDVQPRVLVAARALVRTAAWEMAA